MIPIKYDDYTPSLESEVALAICRLPNVNAVPGLHREEDCLRVGGVSQVNHIYRKI